MTDDERREVAARLRGIDAMRIDRRCGPVSSELVTLAAVDEVVGSRVEGYTFSATRFRDRLIDLIEPGCDREALLALAEEAEKNAWYFALDHDEDELRYRLAEAAEDFSDMARRIREACGEVGQ